ncbi:uncharacterized protein F5Z01DRAFT_637371 [Emericellopsis atlantica]|uniref:Uncharacterized protein n=1 Tax=Emericellopsis atlantica TaxID=2614577 RepID=A0A9P7ZK59_9HYPO|nr:uncharacterized protein F5Z01DRAFT_637371 [Emericellopsis atlantica]KAG9253628.1 hypothetical protein F5Z01DRAFT_637371 [Emericellopsis atlantica]
MPPTVNPPTPPASDDEFTLSSKPTNSPMQRYNASKRATDSTRFVGSGSGSSSSSRAGPSRQAQPDAAMEHQDCTGCLHPLPRDRQAVERAHALESRPDASQSNYSGATAGPGVTQFNNFLVQAQGGGGDHGPDDDLTSMWPYVSSKTERARHIGACKTGVGKQINGPALIISGRASKAPLPTITIPRQTHIDPVMSLGAGAEGMASSVAAEDAAQVNGGFILFQGE